MEKIGLYPLELIIDFFFFLNLGLIQFFNHLPEDVLGASHANF